MAKSKLENKQKILVQNKNGLIIIFSSNGGEGLAVVILTYVDKLLIYNMP